MRYWVQTLVALIALAMVLDHLLPRSALRRDVQMVTGLVILLAMLQPLLGLVRGDWEPDWERLEAAARAALAPDPRLAGGAGVRGWQDETARRIFADALARRAEAALLAVDGVARAEAEVELEPAGYPPAVRSVRVRATLSRPVEADLVRQLVAAAVGLDPGAVEVRLSGP